MMEHDEAVELVAVLALDALDADERREVEEHVAQCPRCLGELDAWREVAGAWATRRTRAGGPVVEHCNSTLRRSQESRAVARVAANRSVRRRRRATATSTNLPETTGLVGDDRRGCCGRRGAGACVGERQRQGGEPAERVEREQPESGRRGPQDTRPRAREPVEREQCPTCSVRDAARRPRLPSEFQTAAARVGRNVSTLGHHRGKGDLAWLDGLFTGTRRLYRRQRT